MESSTEKEHYSDPKYFLKGGADAARFSLQKIFQPSNQNAIDLTFNKI
jgi:hypothetical protein